MTEDNLSKAEVFAKKIKIILQKAVANRIINRHTLTEIDAIKHDIRALGFTAKNSLSRWAPVSERRIACGYDLVLRMDP